MPIESRRCHRCHKQFRYNAAPYNVARGKGKFCSAKCRVDATRIRPEYAQCELCGKTFKNLIGGGIRRFCSHKCYAKFLIGKPLSKETKEKLREACLKNGNVPKPRYGKDNNMWKGGITQVNEKIRKSITYKKWRTTIFQRDDYTCQECGKRGKKLHAHHLDPFSTNLELRFSLKNGITLCVECHRKTETFGVNFIRYGIVA